MHHSLSIINRYSESFELRKLKVKKKLFPLLILPHEYVTFFILYNKNILYRR